MTMRELLLEPSIGKPMRSSEMQDKSKVGRSLVLAHSCSLAHSLGTLYCTTAATEETPKDREHVRLDASGESVAVRSH